MEIQAATDFLLRNIDSLKFFIKKMNEDFGQDNLVFALKMYVLNQNKVFDMPAFMKRQGEMAEEYVKGYDKEVEPEERRNMLNLWVQENAAAYRKHTIFKQMRYIEKMQAEIVPVIEKALKQ